MQNNRVSESEMVACFQSTSLESLPEQATKQEADLENAKAGLPQWNTGCVKPKKHPQFKKVQEPSRIIKNKKIIKTNIKKIIKNALRGIIVWGVKTC